MRARLVVVLAALLASAVLATPASAGPLLSDGDAAELAQSLAEATAEQDVCYGWRVDVSDSSGGPSGIDVGSGAGPGIGVTDAENAGCTRVVELFGSVRFTCESCEADDSSNATVVSTLPNGPRIGDLEALGLDGGDLKGDDGDVVLANMVGALPIVAASKGAAPELEADALTGPTGAAARDRATGSPRVPDWLRESWLALAVCLLAILGGVWWFVSVVLSDRSAAGRAARLAARRRRRAAETDPPAPKGT